MPLEGMILLQIEGAFLFQSRLAKPFAQTFGDSLVPIDVVPSQIVGAVLIARRLDRLCEAIEFNQLSLADNMAKDMANA